MIACALGRESKSPHAVRLKDESAETGEMLYDLPHSQKLFAAVRGGFGCVEYGLCHDALHPDQSIARIILL